MPFFVAYQARRPASAPVSAAGGGRTVLRRLREDERGLALTEFALILPVLMLLLIAMLDMGKAFNYWIDQTHLANQGARWAAVDWNPGGTSATLQQYIAADANTDELESGGTSSVPGALNVAICFPSGTSNVGDPVEVQVSTTYHWLPIIGDTISVLQTEITGSATMRIEREPSNYDQANNIGTCS